MEKRAHQRCRTVFPIQFQSDENVSRNSFAITGETANISEGGAKISCNAALADLPASMHIDLPPCYSQDPKSGRGIDAKVKVIWKHASGAKGRFIHGVQFLGMSGKDKELLRGIVKYELEKAELSVEVCRRPALDIHREPHSCNMYAVDLTVGCQSGCLYCHFSRFYEDAWRKKYPDCDDFPIPVDISPLYKMEEMPQSVVYLSPSSDPFAPKAKELTHELLEYMLPKGVIFTIATKNRIPLKTIKLLRRYRHLIEGIAVSVVNLDEKRNALIEPHAVPGQERVEHIRQLRQGIGCPVGARMDPMFPLIDDTDDNLCAMISAVAKAGAVHLSGTYLFSFGKFLIELKKNRQLEDSLSMLTAKCYTVGGKAYSVPMDYKKNTYNKMNEMCKKLGVRFSTCGCKQIDLKEEGYSLICRNMDFYKSKGV